MLGKNKRAEVHGITSQQKSLSRDEKCQGLHKDKVMGCYFAQETKHKENTKKKPK